MCGIAGYVGRWTETAGAAVQMMSDRQVHRGPDAEGVFTTPLRDGFGAVLGHRRLSIIDTSSDGIQPMHDDTTSNVVVFNGEIYNYRELRAQLAADALSCQTRTDTEVILKAFTRWGEGALERLRGMYAFALWDAQARRVLLARDRLGIKPLYYAEVEHADGARGVLLASELRALLATNLVSRELDPKGLSTYLWNGFVVGPHTIVRGAKLLPPGTLAMVDPENPCVAPRRFWQVPRAGAAPQATGRDLGERLEEAIRQHLISDVPLGVFLSGGVDSSAIASLAVRCSGSTIKTFNISFDESEFDEAPYARRVAEAIGTEHTELTLTGGDLLGRLPEAMKSLDQPTFDGINTYFVSRATRDAGVTVALAGTGGDEVFGGYQSFAELPRARRAQFLLRRLPEIRVGRLIGLLRRQAVPSQVRWGKIDDLLATRGRLLDLYQVAYAIFTTDFLRELRPDAHGGDTSYGLPGDVHADLDDLIAGRSDLSGVSTLELSCFISERLLRDTDAASMAASLEVRVPLLDHVVVETAFAVPDDERFGRPTTKQLLRRLALSELDPAIFDRQKAGFVLPIDRWARHEMRSVITETLLDEQLCRDVGLEPAAVTRLWEAFLSGHSGIYWTRMWAIFVLLWWCREQRVCVN